MEASAMRHRANTGKCGCTPGPFINRIHVGKNVSNYAVPLTRSKPNSIVPYVGHASRRSSKARYWTRLGVGSSTDICSAETSSGQSTFDRLASGQARKYIMISGKGGVGKTSLASSLALRLAEEGHTTLVVSTDPAHSLSDSLSQNLQGGVPRMVEGTEHPLWAMEIDPEREKDIFRTYTEGQGRQDVQEALSGFGLGSIVGQLADLNLGELLETPPPGFDEAVAIAKVVQFVTHEEFARFTRIVFDTAPTGHTLRLLTAPDFAEATLEKVARLRDRLASGPSVLRALFQVSGKDSSPVKNSVIDRLDQLRERISLVRGLLRDPHQMEFIVATIPTALAMNESSRLLGALRQKGVPCRTLVVNQVLHSVCSGTGSPDAYLRARLKDQARAIELLEGSPTLCTLRAIKAPYMDLEVRGVPSLGYFGSTVFDNDVLDENNNSKSFRRRFYMLGGKGGVGKTSCSASLALRIASTGHHVLLVSTDPAHSLSDCLDQDVGGGQPVSVQGAEGALDAIELDLAAERAELSRLLQGDNDDGNNNKASASLGGFLGSALGVNGLLEQLRGLNLEELLDPPPPGLDEAIAIAKVVQLLDSPQYKQYDRIVFDTAPTGHTLRLLSLPDFLDTGMGKILLFKQRMAALSESIKGFFKGNREKKKYTFESIREQLAAAKRLFHDKEHMQFVPVTIPTVMAVNETERLVQALQKEGIPTRALIVNQVISPKSTATFLENQRKDQARAIESLQSLPDLQGLDIIMAPQFDLEVRGLPALDYFGRQVWTKTDTVC